MPLFEGCCSNPPIDRKKSTAYIPSTYQLDDKYEIKKQQQQQQEENNCQPISPSTSEHMLPKSLHKKKSSCCSHGNEKNCTVRFNEGLLTGSTEMLNATKFYQNCANEDTESHWMEIYNEQKIIEQISSGNYEENEVIAPKLSIQSTVEIGTPRMDNNNAFLERTHSAESKIDGNFNGYLQRCHEMENIDKVAYKG
ncbi:Uncharacterized protein BM_BM629 [Brugia malayi]|uniref:Uncharacterized protein n=1 Tax=Brugia malayi TaxID=6279 RepID=A0A4E9FIX3_BRUMA|nr:Uncharacterized protein BM_BM629 [Brugia malayi]VIO94790.1 Uncharacterized protein BM_BM629 [Brugia malayi]